MRSLCQHPYPAVMPIDVRLGTVRPRRLAAVRRGVAPGQVGTAWRPALDLVWSFCRQQGGLWAGDHNLLARPFQDLGPVLKQLPLAADRTVGPAAHQGDADLDGVQHDVEMPGPAIGLNRLTGALLRHRADSRRCVQLHWWT